MGSVGDAKEWLDTHRAMRGTVVVMVATLVVLLAPASQASHSHHSICPTYKNHIKLFPFDTVYFGTNSSSVIVKMLAAGCVNDTQLLKLSKFTESNETSQNEKNIKWYAFNYCGNNVARIGSITRKLKPEISSSLSKCSDSPITLRMGLNVVLGKKCKGAMREMEAEDRKAACQAALHQAVPNTDEAVITIPPDTWEFLDKLNLNISNLSLGGEELNPLRPDRENNDKLIFPKDLLEALESNEPGVDKSGNILNWPKTNYDDILRSVPATPSNYNLNGNTYFGSDKSLSKQRHYKENAIPIFIGIVVFSVSMCLRFCLCRAKSVVRRVTTVTVIRSAVGGPDASQDQQDPPPSYVDVVNESTSPQSPTYEGDIEPPPPAYADIVDEVHLPSYSEVEAQSMPACEEVPLADQETGGSITQPLSDPTSDPPDGKGSPTSKNVLTKYRSQQKQFAFKVLDEDE